MISLALRYFLEVARKGSVAAAAQTQHVAASAISRQIAKLEDQLGVALFERQARGMSLSDAGRQLAAYANAAAHEAERVADELRERSRLGDVTLRIACTEGFAHRFMPQCMADFKHLHPQTRFHLHVDRPEAVNQRVLDGQAQMALRYTLATDERLRTELVSRAPVYAVMWQHHALAARRSISVRDLRKLPLALGDRDTTVRQLFDVACANAGLHLEPAYVSNYSAAFLPLLPGSDIVALSGYLTLADKLDAAGLVALPFSNTEMQQRSVQVLTLAGSALPPLARVFLQFLEERLRHATPEPARAARPRALVS
ncbi:LysR family transcriptional regulator [Bordetella genomosp. 1]|uniref:LysR family transcriptional regulator n=1 Tax=Bordetella genomosp. 1 TaxID=1395607 RepID=A0A261RXF9_9BORD|nr:LysR family transcriptional regulator [Bordetella genomosp. 1]OZI29260.1 LysR family transcriptional regulator [Bordetella genomosp. 1]OZI65009.1 LysR family transcriptional regulator [Bordetella genomosp. 1]